MKYKVLVVIILAVDWPLLVIQISPLKLLVVRYG